MKKLIVIALLMTGMASFAQEKQPLVKKEKAEQLTPEQRNELRLKKMTLDLGLNASQQKEMGKLIAEQSTKFEAAKAERKAKKDSGTKPTADERFKMKSKMLDEQIAMNDKVKKILTPEQFTKWEAQKENRKHQMAQRHKKHKMKPEGEK